jgi:hypothetical protein
MGHSIENMLPRGCLALPVWLALHCLVYILVYRKGLLEVAWLACQLDTHTKNTFSYLYVFVYIYLHIC